jgi:phosphate-selective porin OprO/OprP
MSGKSKLLTCTSLIVAVVLAGPAFAKSAPAAKAPTNVELLKRIEKLESDLQAQKDNQRSTKARVTTLEQNANDVQWSFDNTRPTIKSGDGRFSLAFRGRFQADFAAFDQSKGLKTNADLSTGSLIRRAYIGVEGKAFKDFWYEFRLNFGGGNGSEGSDPQINIARIAYVGIPHFRVNVGVIEPVFGMGNNVSSGQLLFLERPEVSNIASQSFGAGDGRKGVEMVFAKEGLLYGADNLIIAASYTGANTGKAAATSTTCTVLPCTITGNNFNNTAEGHGPGTDEQSQILAHAAYRFWSDSNSNFQVGGNYARVLNVNGLPGGFSLSERPEIRVDGTSLINTGTIVSNAALNSASMWGVEAQAQYKNFYVGGEYHKYDFDATTKINSPHFDGWYVEGSWVLTGEHKGYEASAMNNEVGAFTMPKAVKPFSLSGHSWGAWELVARYSTLDLNFNLGKAASANPIAGGVQRGTTIGVNWYLNQNIRLMLDDTMLQVERSSVTTVGKINNLSGQNMNILAARAQFQF